MKSLSVLLFLFFLLDCRAQSDSSEGGGRDVSVALFSSQPTRSVTVMGMTPQAWWARCATCPHRPFTTPLHVPGMPELLAGGLVSVRDEEHGQVSTVAGLWHLRSAGNDSVDVVLTVPSERYVAAVLMGETSPGDPHEYLLAMAVVARTFVLKSGFVQAAPAAVLPRHLHSDICDSTACQAARFGPVPSDISAAVRSTTGETLWFGPQRAQVFFSGHCGGMTENAGAVWPKLANLPYLRSTADPYCTRKDRAPWHAEVSLKSLEEVATQEHWRLPKQVVTAQVTERTVSQRVRTLVFSGNGQQARVSATALRLAIGRALGWNLVRSDAYDIRMRDGMLVFDGYGHGHGVGLCQQGAMEMARLSESYRRILAFYFPGTMVRVTRSDEGWKQTSEDGVTFVSTLPLSQATRTAAVNAWKQANTLFASRKLSPSITFAPSTELFRQMTSQPGWQVASTSGVSIVIQPRDVVASSHLPLEKLFLHEMLHVHVEAVVSANAPLWLREGIVEVLAGDAASTLPALLPQQTNQLLEKATSRTQSQAAHRAAGARARLLVERYGMPRVRDWLETGSSLPVD